MNLTQIQAIKDEREQQLRELKSIGRSNTLKAIDEIRRKNHEADKILVDVKKIDTKIDIAELACTKTVRTKYNFQYFQASIKIC